MSVKRFTAPDMRRALELVRREMGPDAIILSSQRTNNGVEIVTSSEIDAEPPGVASREAFATQFDKEHDQAFASDQAWQIEAGAERSAQKFHSVKQGADEKPSALPTGFSNSGIGNAMEKFEHKLQENREQRAEKQRLRVARKASQEEGTQKLDELQNEIADMRLLMEEQMWRMNQNSSGHFTAKKRLGVAEGRLQTQLERLGLPSTLIGKCVAQSSPGERLNTNWKQALAKIAKQLPVDTQDPTERGGIFALVGATGVGKTTTLAKLAARYVLKHGMGKVALVATDSYRVGAHEQLRALGKILGVPVRVADQERSLASVLDGLKSFPLVLIDTAGFRHGDPHLAVQEAMLESCPAVQRVVVLAANSQLPSMTASIKAYRRGRAIGCVLTKLDETVSLGETLGLMIQEKLPIFYTTDGQEIPQDLSVASSKALILKAVDLAKHYNPEMPLASA